MRICLVYDCLFPWTVGGAERWTRNVGEVLAADGHEITYLTRLQWAPGEEPDIPGIRVIAVSKAEELYGPDGNRTIGQALRFGRGVARHLAANRGAYDVVHVSASPFFGLAATGLVRRLGRYRVAADWHEVWSDHYWAEYLGGAKGRVAALVQRLCARIPQQAFCFSAMHAQRLRELGLRNEPTVLRGEWAGSLERPQPRPAEPLVVFAGRMIPEKHALAVVPAIIAARERIPELRAVIFGSGPEFEDVCAEVARLDADAFVETPGFADEAVVQETLGRATCLLLPSTREGYGMVVIEAAAQGVPTVLVAAEDNAATEHIAQGVNGFVAPDVSPAALAAAVVACHDAGPVLREATADWFAEHAQELSVAASLRRVVAAYGGHAR
ncbi:MAG TPA: glycosyltransferase [Baekduia sp.]|nr:glycosyltransferase [Baekduia sp.]